MRTIDPGRNPARPVRRGWLGALVWLAAWAITLALDAHLDLANQALLLVLASAVAALWWSAWASLLACSAAVLAFNFAYVPPRGTFAVDLRQHVLLLLTMLGVSWIVALLMARLRRLAAQEGLQAMQAEQLRRFGDALRELDDPGQRALRLQDELGRLSGAPVTLLMQAGPAAAGSDGGAEILLGAATPDQHAGLRLSLQQGHAMGPGTGRHEEQPAWYLPMRGRNASFGAAWMAVPGAAPGAAGMRAHAQALCDQMGAALERSAALDAAAAAREAAQAEALRNTLLAAISHDHRTPLGTILGAASALHDQAERLSLEQRRRLACTIVDEATQLSRLTANTLELARLASGALALRLEWESAEEIVGSVLQRRRRADPAHRVKARVEPGLPLLRCDAILLVQLLDNLVDNALRHGGDVAPVEIVARQVAGAVVLAVRDRGAGVPPEQRERIFEAFQRGPLPPMECAGATPARRGAGVGLALCRAIAQAHGAHLRLRARGHGGSSFELVLPVQPAPAAEAGPHGQGATG
jgi:two-component system, OmpR family, sensor histidine kinase KdpD